MVLLPATENLCPLELIQLNFVSGSRGFRMQKGSDLYQPVFINDLMYPGRKCFPGGSDGKESACNVGDLGSISGLGRSPGGGCGNPLQNSCLENFMAEEPGGPWGHKESDMTQQLVQVLLG